MKRNVILSAILAGVVGVVGCAGRERARRTKCASNLKQMGYGCHLWSADNNELFPPSLDALFPKYILDKGIFECASSPGSAGYSYVSGLSAAHDAGWMLAFDNEGNHGGDGRNALYIGGHVMWHPEEAFKRNLEKTIKEATARGRKVSIIKVK